MDSGDFIWTLVITVALAIAVIVLIMTFVRWIASFFPNDKTESTETTGEQDTPSPNTKPDTEKDED